jgi:four helix bundle protein
MATVERFEDLVAWQKARALTRDIYAQTRSGNFARDFGLVSQIQRAVVSVKANVAEGFERGGRAEFHQFLSTAKGSCAELRSHLYVASDVGYLTPSDFEQLLDRAEELSRILAGLRSAVQRQRDNQRGANVRVLSPKS